MWDVFSVLEDSGESAVTGSFVEERVPEVSCESFGCHGEVEDEFFGVM